MLKHARRLFVAFGVALATAVAPMATTAQAQTPYLQLLPSTQSKYAAIVVDAKSGEVLYAKRADSPRYPASITKVMTLYLTFEALAAGKIQLDDPVPFSPRAAAQSPTKLGVRAGGSITVHEAIQSLTTLSANDTAVAMAEKLGGTEGRFTALMTLRAKELGMSNTNFANANGLPDSRNISTARDLAILSRAVMRDYPQYYRYFTQTNFNFRGRNYRNHNHLLTGVPGVDGLKTGFTNASGFNIAISGVREGRRLIVVVLGGPTRVSRDKAAEGLLLTGFDVMNRRARGENITVAQNFFESDLVGPIVQGRTAQGDEDDVGDRIKLAAATPAPRASQVKIVEPKKKDSWSVQVGAFKSRADAKEQIDLIEKRFGAKVDGARPTVDKAGGRYRSRFVGMSEYEARQACKAIKAKKMACAVASPQG
ncbi:D-alanyl-D-alanine carboxypeptidase [Phenylobacterium sp.]|jgi:D-alanyl-D-alanine carboxypeptidase (penicillin-binding protein 5/6)|uniref:D-alanyl-D-alanine carboxypeptidase n=1 Tax=Phenylobacterium sp. TaxID=1871053 RepID=UPI002F935049